MQAGYLLGTVLAEHPGMKAVVVAEVQRFLFRAGLQERARYYAVVFLNQLQLSHHPAHGAHPASRPWSHCPTPSQRDGMKAQDAYPRFHM